MLEPAAHPHRLLLVLTEFPPSVGGMQTHARHLAAHLAQRGHVVEVVTYRVTDAALAQAAHQFDAAAPYPVHRVLSRLGYWANLQALQRLAQRFRPDAVYASTVFYGLLHLARGEQAAVPLLCRSVGNDVLRPWQGYPYRWLSQTMALPVVQRGLRRWLEHGWHPDWVDHLFRRQRERLMRQAAARHACVLANSGYTAALLSEAGVAAERIQVVSGGVDSASFAPASAPTRAQLRAEMGLQPHEVAVLTVCRLVPKKGVEVLLAALAQLQGSLPQLRLLVVGDGQRRRAYQVQARRLGLAWQVRFVGRVPHERVRQYFQASDLFVLASYESRHAGGASRDVETMGRVLCEANAAALPLIATDSGGVPSVVRHGHNGWLVPPANAPALAQAIHTLWHNPALRQRLVQAGLQRARSEFDWSRVLAAHEAAISAAIAQAGSGSEPAKART